MDQETNKGPSGMIDSNPMMLLDAIVRNKIFSCRYWKEQCFGLNAESLVDKALELDSVGGTHQGTGKPTNFLCLIAKLLQINPDKDIIFEFIKNRDYKYVNALAIFYFRLVGKPIEVYQILELFYSDYRKIRIRNKNSTYSIIYMDELIDNLLHDDVVFDVTLPRLPKRFSLEEQGTLQPRKSAIEDELIIEDENPPEQQQIEGQYNKEIFQNRERSRSNKKEKKKEKKEKKEKGEKKKFKFKHKHQKEANKELEKE